MFIGDHFKIDKTGLTTRIADNMQTMFEIDNKIVSLDLFTEKFACDVDKCKGYCCVYGESGAPLEKEEVKILKQIFPELKEFLRPDGIQAIEKKGTSVVDMDKDKVTPLIGRMECAYAIFEKGIARCGIEKAFEAGVISFRKPLSCHLYPVRIKKYDTFEAINYDRLQICDPARECGNKHNIPLYVFVRDALIRKYGEEFIRKLEQIAREIEKV
jgi:hypothetical protein